MCRDGRVLCEAGVDGDIGIRVVVSAATLERDNGGECCQHSKEALAPEMGFHVFQF